MNASGLLDSTLDATYAVHARFRHGAFAEPCPTCHVPAGELCLARRSVHVARRKQYQQNQQVVTLVPLLVARGR